eukprot:1926159-Ditylum_brightwellii.AAC.1
MRSIVGDAIIQGGAVVSVDGTKVSSSADLIGAWEKAKQNALAAGKNTSGGEGIDHGEPHI